MLDSNSNGQNDTLIINITVNSTYTAFFEVYFDLSEESGTLSNRINQSISSGISNVNISFDTRLLTKNKYNYSVRIYNTTNILVFSKYNIETNTYSGFGNGTNINRITDENLNSNHIRINLTLNVSQNQDANITAYLKFNETIISATKQVTLSSGLQTISLDFDNETIKSTHYTGNFTLDSVLIGRKLIKPSYSTSIYNYEDFAKTSYFRNYSSTGIDTNANNLSEFLEVNFTVAVKSTNTYEIQAEMYDQFNNFVKNLSASQSLSIGNQTVSIRINGSDIYAAKISGPYILSVTRLIENGNITDKQFEPHTITNLTYTDFERPPLPDLKLNMTVIFNQTTNQSNVTIKLNNTGESTAFNVFLDVFNNETFSAINSTVILNVNESQIYNFIVSNTSNITLFTAIADFDNLVDESNESNNIVQNTPPTIVSLAIESITAMYTNGTLKIFEFVILNDGDTAVTDVQWWFDTNDSYIINSTSNISSLAVNERAFVYVQYNFSDEGSYNIRANATGLSQSTIISSSLSSSIGVGDLAITSFDDVNTDVAKVIFEIQAKNNLESNITNVNWSLTTGNNGIINSTSQFASIQPNETIFIFVKYDYGASGTYSLVATVTNQTYSDSKTLNLDIKHLEAFNLSIVNESGNKRIFEFVIKNNLNINLTGVNWSLNTNNSNIINSTISSILQPSEQMFIYIDYNFTASGTYNVNATARNNSLTDSRNLTITI
ncbi:hypothetical protein HYX08_07290 [Candidatus Woesearchaeota archaeon]|nr:hypothetical protein [Candidatus Woesearchaeota archaeon]